MVIFHSYVGLPEGNTLFIIGFRAKIRGKLLDYPTEFPVMLMVNSHVFDGYPLVI